ncbi:hypothetical protein Aple_038430 [Acrocarpospora pleiomorpha]|uniref:Uncharacterized protein n=1 Tax=Acrocarpospora pleiomorpha TaxID=90975 RepID=A0A5M3XHI4_9ACTN|nr:hypothetical protein [Acrocarpospora pleiomorpha]GES20947.1 hypothetical protein Aple_038430 [Acrocarpospora pleiomorpha]
MASEDRTSRSVARYARHRFVRLLNALDPVIGIVTELTRPSPAMVPGAMSVLASLIVSATAESRLEVELDTATVEPMAAANGWRTRADRVQRRNRPA